MKKSTLILILAILSLIAIAVVVPTTIENFFLPGSQPGQSGNIETPDRCDNCHGGYDLAVEPAFNWRGSMMSQAARDPLFYACLAIAEQDAPGVGDMCLRCHTPDGWLNGRCEPTDGSALNNNDREGVQCDFCHKMVKPTLLGVNPFQNDPIYTAQTYPQDQSYLAGIIPLPGGPGNGMYIADANNAKRGPFSDAVGRHQMFYSPFHSQSEHCGTCHDVSNPVLTRVSTEINEYIANSLGVESPTFDVRKMFPIERTYSEWLASGYNKPKSEGGMTCQDCHMRDVTGKGAKMKDAPIRPDLPLHDMTGGNTFVPNLVKLQFPAEVNSAALDAGMERARTTLKSAATLELTVADGVATVKVTNNTGHKLPTGYPEGRRIWINMKFIDATGQILEEYGNYNLATGVLTQNTKIYHCEPGISETMSEITGISAGPSFHMALNDMIYYDNRIPPIGSTNAGLLEKQSPVVDHDGIVTNNMYPDGQNWDITQYPVPAETEKIEASLYYQTASKEFIEFLRDENTSNSRGDEIYALWDANGKSTPELMNKAVWPFEQPKLTAAISSVTRVSTKRGVYGEAIILLTDNEGAVTSNVVVNASYDGPSSGSVSGTTDNKGQVILQTKSVKNPAGVWCFTVTNAIKTGYVFDGQVTACEPALKSAFIGEPISDNFLNVYPNPFSEKLRFEFVSPESVNARIDLYDMTGRMVKTIFEQPTEGGTMYNAEFKPEAIISGMYFYRVQMGEAIYNGKVVFKKE